MMKAMPVLIVVWAVFMGLFLALLAYNATISRYEESQLFLYDINQTEQQEQTSIVRKVERTLPYVRALGTLSAVLALVIVAIYTWDCWQRLNIQ